LTSDGRIKPCLHGTRSYDVRRLLRTGAHDQAVVGLIQEALRDKMHYTKWTAPEDEFLMQHVGG
jgi:molybdenum cofactor biosynthesis enzyme MoaA